MKKQKKIAFRIQETEFIFILINRKKFQPHLHQFIKEIKNACSNLADLALKLKEKLPACNGMEIELKKSKFFEGRFNRKKQRILISSEIYGNTQQDRIVEKVFFHELVHYYEQGRFNTKKRSYSNNLAEGLATFFEHQYYPNQHEFMGKIFFYLNDKKKALKKYYVGYYLVSKLLKKKLLIDFFSQKLSEKQRFKFEILLKKLLRKYNDWINQTLILNTDFIIADKNKIPALYHFFFIKNDSTFFLTAKEIKNSQKIKFSGFEGKFSIPKKIRMMENEAVIQNLKKNPKNIYHYNSWGLEMLFYEIFKDNDKVPESYQCPEIDNINEPAFMLQRKEWEKTIKKLILQGSLNAAGKKI